MTGKQNSGYNKHRCALQRISACKADGSPASCFAVRNSYKIHYIYQEESVMIAKEKKQEIMKAYARTEGDTGSRYGNRT